MGRRRDPHVAERVPDPLLHHSVRLDAVRPRPGGPAEQRGGDILLLFLFPEAHTRRGVQHPPAAQPVEAHGSAERQRLPVRQRDVRQ